MRSIRLADLLLLFITLNVLPQWMVQGQTPSELLLSGPMASATGQDSTIIWLQTTRSTQASIRYQAVGSDSVHYSIVVRTGFDNIAHIPLRNLKPDTEYRYELWLNDRLYPLGYTCHFRTAPNSIRDIRFATGSCAWVWGLAYDPKKPFQRPYTLNNELYRNLLKHSPEFMLWLGDNLYLNGNEMYQSAGIRYRYRYARSLTNLQPFMGQTSHFAIWDDHDFGPNDSESNFVLKDTSLKVFQEYFPPVHDPSVSFKGITRRMRWGDVEFFLLDDRFYRNSKQAPYTVFGQQQLAWLKKYLKTSTAPFKALVIGSEIFNFTHVGESVIEDFEAEILGLLDYIAQEKITGVFILSGDRHYAEVNRYVPKGGYPIYEYCISPMLSPPAFFLTYKHSPTRVGKLSFNKRNYGIVDITGKTPNDRKLSVYIYDLKGRFRWKHEVYLKELQFASVGKVAK